ncbi:MAG: hypothetical protein WC365_09670, partial [Candidatus Babeliales bacterium]
MAYSNFNYETRFTAINTMTPAVNEAANSMEMLRGSTQRAGESARSATQDFQGLNSAISTGGFKNARDFPAAIDKTSASLMNMRG